MCIRDSSKNMVLRNDDILANVCQFVGSGHFYFVANVNTKFRDAYKQFLTGGESDDENGGRFVTTAESIAESISRVQCAWNERTIDEIDDIKWSSDGGRTFLWAIARKGDLPAIEWLMHRDQRPTFHKFARWTSLCIQRTLCNIAAQNGHLEVLQRILENGDSGLNLSLIHI